MEIHHYQDANNPDVFFGEDFRLERFEESVDTIQVKAGVTYVITNTS